MQAVIGSVLELQIDAALRTTSAWRCRDTELHAMHSNNWKPSLHEGI